MYILQPVKVFAGIALLSGCLSAHAWCTKDLLKIADWDNKTPELVERRQALIKESFPEIEVGSHLQFYEVCPSTSSAWGSSYTPWRYTLIGEGSLCLIKIFEGAPEKDSIECQDQPQP